LIRRTSSPRLARKQWLDDLQERHDRLDHARERACSATGTAKEHPTQTWESVGQAGEGDADGARIGRGDLPRISRCVKGASNIKMQPIGTVMFFCGISHNFFIYALYQVHL